MKFALVNPDWNFEGSIYFGCQEPHYPLELLFAFDKIKEAGHEPLLIDAQVDKLSIRDAKARLDRFNPDYLVIPTAPSYLFWRCPPPELRVPQQWFAALEGRAVKVAIGPHASATPGPTLRKLNCDVVFRGEPDEVIPLLPSRPCLITDLWTGVETFFVPGSEILTAANAHDVVECLRNTSAQEARAIGSAMRQRALRDHTYSLRAQEFEKIVSCPGTPAQAAERDLPSMVTLLT